MPFLGLATSGDLQHLRSDLEEKSCTTLINGIYLCETPKYTDVKDPENLVVNDIVSPTNDFCVRFDHIPDLGIRLGPNTGHGDIPDNYVCVDSDKLKQYVDAFMPQMPGMDMIGSMPLMNMVNMLNPQSNTPSASQTSY